MYSLIVIIATLLMLGMVRASVPAIWIAFVIVVYCLLGNAAWFLVNSLNVEIVGNLLGYLNSGDMLWVDPLMALTSLSFILGVVLAHKQWQFGLELRQYIPTKEEGHYVYRFYIRIVWLSAVLFVLLLLFARNAMEYGGTAEEIRLQLLLGGYWPMIIALFGWVLPFLALVMVWAQAAARPPQTSAISTNICFVFATAVLILSLVIGFRTYVLVFLLLLFSLYSYFGRLPLVRVGGVAALGVFGFIAVTIVRVEAGESFDLMPLGFSIFRRFALEPLGAAVYVKQLIDQDGLYWGFTLLQDLWSKMPGRQETFAGQLGVLAGFDEGLTLTPSGLLELYANFGYFSVVAAALFGWLIATSLLRVKPQSFESLGYGMIAFLFGIEFAMGGSSAFFDCIVRLVIFGLLLRVRLSW